MCHLCTQYQGDSEMKRVYLIYMIFIGILALSSCANPTPSYDTEKLFSEMYKDCSMNEALRLSLMEPMYNGDEDLNLLLESITNASVTFPAGYNLRLLSFDNNQNKWVEENNNIQYLPLDAKYTVGKNDPKVEFDHIIILIVPSREIKKALRIVVHGHIYENGVETEKCTGAFSDIVVTP